MSAMAMAEVEPEDPVTAAQRLLRFDPWPLREARDGLLPWISISRKATRAWALAAVIAHGIPRGESQASTPHDYRRSARWWELESTRGYPSSAQSALYGRNMRQAAALVNLVGPGSWLELQGRAARARRVQPLQWNERATHRRATNGSPSPFGPR